MFAKLVGEGYDNPNAGEVLDVNYSKVGEWLVSLRLRSGHVMDHWLMGIRIKDIFVLNSCLFICRSIAD